MNIKLMMITGLLTCALVGYAQSLTKIEETRINMKFTDKELGQVLKELESKLEIHFSFSADIQQIKVSGNYQDKPLKEFLDDLSQKGLVYLSLAGQITIYRKEKKSVPNQNMRGLIYDEQTKATLVGATVKIINSDPIVGDISGLDGSFVLKQLPLGRYNLQVSFIGYQSRILDNVVLDAGKETVLEIGLTEDISKLGPVVVSGYKNKVTPTNQAATVSARSISSEETERFAGSLSDPARMALSYAGVTSGNGYNNEIIVRGNSPSGLLWRLEGIEIANPNHFAVEGSSGGFINILNSNNMSRSDFFVSAFPAEFGNATSGIFDLKMRKGNTQNFEHTLEASTMGLRASTEGPLGSNNGSYLVNYRYSLMGLTQRLFLDDLNLPDYQDATFKVNLPTKKAGTFALFGLGGTGKWEEESSVGWIDTLSNQPVEKTWYDLQRYDLGIMGLSHAVPFKNKKTYLESVAAISTTRNRPSSSSFNYEVMEPYLQERGKYAKTEYRMTTTMNHKVNAAHFLSAGVKLNHLQFKLESESGLPNGEVTKELDRLESMQLTQSFISWQWKPSYRWIINSGAHLTHFSLSSELVVEPRLGLEYALSDKQSVSFGAGLHSRHESVATYFGEQNADGVTLRPNENLKLSKAAHLVLGYNTTIAEDVHIKLETYYQYRYDIPVENDTSSSYSSINQDVSFTTVDLTNEGVGKNYGVELTLEKNFSNNYYFLFTGSLYDSKYKAKDNQWRNTKYNNHYALNLLGGKEFVLNRASTLKYLGLNLRGAYTGGKRVTSLDLQKSIEAGYGVEISEKAYQYQLSDYYRLDFSIYYKWEKKGISQQLKLDILNLLENNVYGIRYQQAKFGSPAKIQEYSFGEEDDETSNLFPLVSYQVRF